VASLRVARVALRIFGDDLDPEGVSALLGGAPTRCHRKGETPDGEVLPAGTGAWVLESPLPDTVEIEEHVAELFAKLTSDVDEWTTVSAQSAVDIRCELEVGESGEGFDLSPRLAAALAERGVVLSFSVV
jgi:hypothetical protein